MNRPLVRPIIVSLCILSPNVVLAHYLWVDVDASAKADGIAHIYFEESPKPGDGFYLDHFLGKSDVWIRTIAKPRPTPLRAREVKNGENRWMRVDIPSVSEFSVDAYGKFGVYDYGKTKVLLHYYARHLSVHSHDTMHELARAEQMELDLVAHEHGNLIEFTLMWRGEPASNRMVFVRGPQGYRRNVRTDAKGRVEVVRPDTGTLTLRSSVEEQSPGTEDGVAYEVIRHNITLVMPFSTADE